MKALVRSVRIAPKKANLVAKMIRGMPVPEAIASLERTNKKAARILEKLLRSAVANAQHNDKQDPSALVVKMLVVNQAQAYQRGIPMARGRTRPIRKFLSHIRLTLGVQEARETAGSAEEARNPKAAKESTESKAKSPSRKKRPSATMRSASSS